VQTTQALVAKVEMLIRKRRLEHGIQLNLVADRHPDGIGAH
jgi:hypothetical protein